MWSFQEVVFRHIFRAQCCFFCAEWGREVSLGALLVLIFWEGECSKWNQFRETLNLSTLSVWSSRDPMLCRKHFPGISIFYIWEVISVLKLLWQKLLGGCFRGMLGVWQAVPSVCRTVAGCEQKRWGSTTDLFRGTAKAGKYSSKIHFKILS